MPWPCTVGLGKLCDFSFIYLIPVETSYFTHTSPGSSLFNPGAFYNYFSVTDLQFKLFCGMRATSEWFLFNLVWGWDIWLYLSGRAPDGHIPSQGPSLSHQHLMCAMTDGVAEPQTLSLQQGVHCHFLLCQHPSAP